MLLPETQYWVVRNKSYRDMTPQKELSLIMGHISKIPLINTWAKVHGIEWIYHIPYHAPASGKIKRYNGVLKTMLKAMGGGTLKHWEKHLHVVQGCC